MKKIGIIFIGIILLFGCACGDKKPPQRALYKKDNISGMQYHIVLYEPFGTGGAHSIKCGSWEYVPTHIYTDKLGTMNGNDVIWKNLDEMDYPFEQNGQNIRDVHLIISKDKITIQGFNYKSGLNTMNGTYKVETTSPDSWGVPIVKGHPLNK